MPRGGRAGLCGDCGRRCGRREDEKQCGCGGDERASRGTSHLVSFLAHSCRATYFGSETLPELLPLCYSGVKKVFGGRMTAGWARGSRELPENMLQWRVRWPCPSGKRMTIREIADLAGVSIATVSRVLNGRDDVADETRDAVRRVIREQGYTANRNARGLSAGRTGLVGVLVPLVFPAYFAEILAGAAEALYEQDMRVVLSPTQHEHDREVSLLDRLMHGGDRRRADHPARGVERGARARSRRRLSVRRRRPADAARRPHPLRFRGARVGRRPGDAPPALARAPPDRRDHRPARLGRDRGPPARLPRGARSRRHHARPGARGRVRLRDHRGRAGARERCSTSATRRRRSSPSTTTSPSARCSAARARGLRIPEDLSIVGFDDVEHASIVTPALTTVRQPLAEMGRTAVSLLIRLLEHQSVETLSVQLATRLVVRESTSPPRARALAATA